MRVQRHRPFLSKGIAKALFYGVADVCSEIDIGAVSAGEQRKGFFLRTFAKIKIFGFSRKLEFYDVVVHIDGTPVAEELTGFVDPVEI